MTTKVNGIGGNITDSMSDISKGDTKTIIFTPDKGYQIDKVLVDNVETPVTNNELELTINKDTTVEVTYKKIPFTITIKENSNACITPNGIINVNYGDNQDFVITANSGYKLAKVLINNKEQVLNEDILKISNITEDLEIEVLVEQIVYKILAGENQTYTISKDKELKLVIDANYSLFNNLVYVDDQLVDNSNYSSKSGSTIITFKQSYLDNLSGGKHTLKVAFEDGTEVETTFTIEKAKVDKNNTNTELGNKTEITSNPKTSDNIMIYITIAIISVTILGTATAVRKRK